MDSRFIIYFIFICLKNLALSWTASRINKGIKISFIELGAITAFSETAGFCFIVLQSQPANWLLWWEEKVSLNILSCFFGFVISVALSVLLLFLLLLLKNQLKRGFVKLTACVLLMCSPYLFFLADTQRLFTVAAIGLFGLFLPIFVSALFSNCVFVIGKRLNKKQEVKDFRFGEVIAALITRYFGLASAFLVLIFTPLKLERLLYVNTSETILLPITAFTIAIILNCIYLSFGEFKVNLPENRRLIPYAVILPLLNAPYLFLTPIINTILVNGGLIRGMYAP